MVVQKRPASFYFTARLKKFVCIEQIERLVYNRVIMKITLNKKVKIEKADLDGLLFSTNKHVSETAIKAVQELNQENQKAAHEDYLRRLHIQVL